MTVDRSLVTLPQIALEISATLDGYQIGRYDIDLDLRSETNFCLARDWIRACMTQHDEPLCSRTMETFLPTRVVDVGPADGTKNPTLMISAGTIGSYIALSHCWGGKIPLTTTEATLATLTKNINMEDLPANFRDAITITRELGFRYLWIDSLCIIQDSRSDWERESAVMGDIYEQATLTIAAAAASDSEKGLLPVPPERQQPLHSSITLKFDAESHLEQKISLSPKNENEESFWDCVYSSPLARRAWTYQEHLLSPRVLMYGARQIYWRCQQTCHSADGAGHPPVLTSLLSNEKTFFLMLSSPKVRAEALSDNLQGIDIYSTWYGILTDFYHRNLTVRSDKFPALAGLAANFQKITGDVYLAGLWRKDIHRGLMWHGDGIAARALAEFRAPSWSWAKIDGEVIHMGAHTDRHGSPLDAEIVLADVEVVGQNPYGEVRSGRLVLHGLTYEAWEVNEDDGFIHMDPVMDDRGKTPHDDGSSFCGDTLTYTLLLVCFLGSKCQD